MDRAGGGTKKSSSVGRRGPGDWFFILLFGGGAVGCTLAGVNWTRTDGIGQTWFVFVFAAVGGAFSMAWYRSAATTPMPYEDRVRGAVEPLFTAVFGVIALGTAGAVSNGLWSVVAAIAGLVFIVALLYFALITKPRSTWTRSALASAYVTACVVVLGALIGAAVRVFPSIRDAVFAS